MSEERRANPNPFDIAGLLAILYTVGYLGMCALLYYAAVPPANEKALLVLFGIMSSIQLQLIGFYFGGSKQVEATARATEQRQGRSAAVVEQLTATLVEKVAPQPTVTPAPTNLETGNTPAAELATQPPKETPK